MMGSESLLNQLKDLMATNSVKDKKREKQFNISQCANTHHVSSPVYHIAKGAGRIKLSDAIQVSREAFFLAHQAIYADISLKGFLNGAETDPIRTASQAYQAVFAGFCAVPVDSADWDHIARDLNQALRVIDAAVRQAPNTSIYLKAIASTFKMPVLPEQVEHAEVIKNSRQLR